MRRVVYDLNRMPDLPGLDLVANLLILGSRYVILDS